MAVHSKLGSGFQELIYQRALAIELGNSSIPFQREKEMTIYYNGVDIGKRRVDFFIDSNIMLELKAMAKLEEIHFVQALNYLEVYSLPIGLLINFGAKSLEFKRVYNTKHPESRMGN